MRCRIAGGFVAFDYGYFIAEDGLGIVGAYPCICPSAACLCRGRPMCLPNRVLGRHIGLPLRVLNVIADIHKATSGNKYNFAGTE